MSTDTYDSEGRRIVAPEMSFTLRGPRPNRAIDRHEDQIVEVLDLVDEGETYNAAINAVSATSGLNPDRLDSLVRTWCAVAGIKVPA
jgi:hypothetical protein